ncbi:MAG: DUF485 domain-containing protein [Candidatus Rokuibacteriota bacterium]
MSEPQVPAGAGQESADSAARATRHGLRLFSLYVILYGGFMGLSAFAPQLMAEASWGGVNLAVLYGMGLIVSALVLAGVYMALCRRSGPPR